MSRGRKIALFSAAFLIVLGVAAVVTGVIVLRSPWFREKVRERIVAEVERATGGKVELKAFDYDWAGMTARVNGFVLHGTEPPGEKPLLTASRVEVGLRIVSALKKQIDVARVRVEQPEFNLLLDENNDTNIPSPKVHSQGGKTIIEDLLRAKIGRLEIANGRFRLLDNDLPLNLVADGVKIGLGYDRSTPRYMGSLTVAKVDLKVFGLPHIDAGVEAAVSLEKNRILAPVVQVKTAESTASVSFRLDNLRRPRIEFTGKGAAAARELVQFFDLPIERQGTVTGEGTFRWDKENRYSWSGNVEGRGLAINRGAFHVSNARIRAAARVLPEDLELGRLQLSATEGEFNGSLRLKEWKNFAAEGRVNRFTLEEAGRLLGKPLIWQGQIEGPLRLQGTANRNGVSNVRSSGLLLITRSGNDHPIDGAVNFEFDQERQKLVLHDSRVMLPSSQVALDGSLGEHLQFTISSNNLAELTPGLQLAGLEMPDPAPFALRNGSLNIQGSASGSLSSPSLEGRASASRLLVQNHLIDSVESNFALSASSLSLRNFTAKRGDTELRGDARVVLANWRTTDSSAIDATFALQKAAIGALMKEAGVSAPVDGLASVSGTVKGALGSPQAAFRLKVDNAVLEGRRFDSVSGAVQLTEKSVAVAGGSLTLSGATAAFEGAFEHAANDWKSGHVRFQISSSSVPLSLSQQLAENLPELKGAISVRAQGTADVKNGEFLLSSLNGAAFSRSLTVRGKSLGRVSLDTTSNGRALQARASLQMPGSKISGNAQMDLAGGYQVKGAVQIESLSLTTLHDLSGYEQNDKPRPFTGSLQGQFQFSGPAREPAKIAGSGAVTSFELKPRTVAEPNTKQPALDLSLRNDGPVRLSYKDGSFRVDNAHFVTKDTNLAVDGSFSPGAKSPLDLRFKGALNLAVLQSFSTDLRVTGLSVMDASLRGSLARPALSGRLEMKNASVFMADVPNGIDNANGTLVFDQNKILIQEIKAQSGGGDLALRGFVGIGGKELPFRLQGTATNVRIRYPEGVSTTVNAELNFTGTQSKSLLSGSATVVRSGLNAKTDFGSLFAASAKPAAEPVTTSDFLRNLQLDVALNTAPNFQLATSYTKNLQTEARLQVRGTAAKPSVLGRINVSEGDIDFFGSTYKVVRGEVNFYNTAAIEPVLDADLETRVRAITVNIKLSGSLNRLNISYRSDPPLSSSEIFALLTAGRSPDMGQVTGTAIATPGDISGGSTGTALLGQVLSSRVSGRLQKFFGVSRLKIDPRAVGLDGTPQAQLTVEQQISRDVTLTYVSNLQNTQQQIVRVEWNVSKQWSAVAVRDANGLFGIDFYYRKRLK